MATTYFPVSKSTQFGRKYLEVIKKYPVDKSIEKTILPTAIRTTHDGIKAISITEIKDGKFKEYMKRFYQHIIEYFPIEGYKVDFEVFLSVTEALSIAGI